MNLRQQLQGFETLVLRAYPDPLTKNDPIKKGDPWTIGWGHTGPEVKKGLIWTVDQAEAALTADIEKATNACMAHIPCYPSLNEARQAVLAGMCFQMGIGSSDEGTGLLGFRHMLQAIEQKRYALAGYYSLQSKWARQTPKRAAQLADQLDRGEWKI